MKVETTTILIDTALASGTASALDPEERTLQELVLAVRDDAPAPDADFGLRMNARVAAGFPLRRAGWRGRLRALVTTRPQLAALGAAASLLIALVVALSLGHGSSSPSQSVSSTAGRASAPNAAAAPAEKSVAPSASNGASGSVAVPGPVPAPPGGGFVGGRNRKVERSAAVVLAPAKDKLSEVGDQVIAVTDRYRGFVLSSSVTSSADQGSNGSFDLRIPVRNLQPALRDLSALADVQSRTENSADVTAPFVSARTRLQELTAERRSLLRRLEKANTNRAAAAIRARLRIVNAQIEGQTRALADLRRRTSYAAVSVTLEPKQGGSGGGGIGSGARDLRDSLVDAANLALRVLGVALPIAILIALLWAGGGWFNRRRREAVLDPATPSRS
ncbi:MAG TPA: DUF4349 domain-containing protein [Thermoleophilaceae bacterium]|nr:DUF4349 domain-containing protein [Thermoleophilaceae bacterium]